MILVPANSVQVGKIYFTQIRRKMNLVMVVSTNRRGFTVSKLDGQILPKIRKDKDLFVRDRYHNDYVKTSFN